MKVIASYNIKGGVGKTASAVNLAHLAARGGARTLVWDLDPQAAACYYFRVKPKVKKGGEGLLRKKHAAEAAIKGTDFDKLDLLPADFSYRNLDIALDEMKKSDRRFHKLLQPLAEDYDYLFLDCPPSISLVSENVFHAADALLVPTIPTTLSLRTLDQLLHFCAEGEQRLKILAFFSMVDMRKKLHRLILENPPRKFGKTLLETAIPYASEVEQMGVHRAPLTSFAPRSRAALAYERLWAEVQAQLAD